MTGDSKFGLATGWGRLKRLTQKELRETLRDRRTIVTLVMMPMLVYPILSLVFRTFILSGMIATPPSDKPIQYRFAVEHNSTKENLDRFIGRLAKEGKPDDTVANDVSTGSAQKQKQPTRPFLEHQWLDSLDEIDLETIVSENSADLGVRLNFPADYGTNPDRRVRVELISDDQISLSIQAKEYFLQYLKRAEKKWLERRGIDSQLPFDTSESSIVKPEKKKTERVSLATLVPLILVLMTITGAVYPAIDLTAGERERGTLESLIAAPIPRMRILIAKFVAVVTVAMLTATLNVIGMLITVWAFQLEEVVFGPVGFTPAIIAQIFLLLLLFAGFFSAVLLVVTSFARSFKEAQAYLVPIILFAMTPGVLSLVPGMTLNGPLAIVPMVNFILLSRDILQGTATIAPTVIVVASTILYSILALAIAARIFGTDAILYGSQTSWAESFRRPRKTSLTATPLTAILCLTLLFPANFVAISIMGRFAENIPIQIAIMVSTTILFFVGVPCLMAWHQRVRFRSGFALRRFGIGPLLAVILLGLSLWPLVAYAVSQTQYIIAFFSGADAAGAWHQRLIDVANEHIARWRQIPSPILIFCFSVVPAVAEEWFFRGFLMQALMKRGSVWKAILWSSIAFGLFHILSQSVVAVDRFLPTAIMGAFLGIVCWRTGSVIPGMILHTLHNGIVVGLGYYNESLKEISWLPFVNDEIPPSFVVGSAVVALVGLAILLVTTRKSDMVSNE